jgi:hypothetical protein
MSSEATSACTSRRARLSCGPSAAKCVGSHARTTIANALPIQEEPQRTASCLLPCHASAVTKAPARRSSSGAGLEPGSAHEGGGTGGATAAEPGMNPGVEPGSEPGVEPGVIAPWPAGSVAARVAARVAVRRPHAHGGLHLELEPLPVRGPARASAFSVPLLPYLRACYDKRGCGVRQLVSSGQDVRPLWHWIDFCMSHQPCSRD